MDRENIIRMVHESASQIEDYEQSDELPEDVIEFFMHFAKLVAAAERKAVLEMIDEFFGMERDRNAMFSDGHDYALYQVKEYVLARGQE